MSRPILFLFLSLLALPAAAQTRIPCGTSATRPCYYERTAATRAAPTAAPAPLYVGSGMSLANVSGTRISICPAAGQTFTGTGHLRVYWWHPTAATWMHNATLDLGMAASTDDNPCVVFPDAPTLVRGGYVLVAADAVETSGTATDAELQDTVLTRLDGQVAQ